MEETYKVTKRYHIKNSVYLDLGSKYDTELSGKVSNMGLLMDKYLLVDSDSLSDSRQLAEYRKNFIQFMTHYIYPQSEFELYAQAFDRWKSMGEVAGCKLITLYTDSPLLLGTGFANVIDMGFMLNKPWGLPYIPGSTIKGCVANYLYQRKNLVSKYGDLAAELFGAAELTKTDGVNQEKSSQGKSGGCVFYDAWIDPESIKQGCFKQDITTVHYQNYYAEKNGEMDVSLLGTENPKPVQFLTLKPGLAFHILVSCENADILEFLEKITVSALCINGIGGKKHVGYGRFRLNKNEAQVVEADPLYEGIRTVILQQNNKGKSWTACLKDNPSITATIAGNRAVWDVGVELEVQVTFVNNKYNFRLLSSKTKQDKKK